MASIDKLKVHRGKGGRPLATLGPVVMATVTPSLARLRNWRGIQLVLLAVGLAMVVETVGRRPLMRLES